MNEQIMTLEELEQKREEFHAKHTGISNLFMTYIVGRKNPSLELNKFVKLGKIIREVLGVMKNGIKVVGYYQADSKEFVAILHE